MTTPSPPQPLLESLDAIHRLSAERAPVSAARLARRLGIGGAQTTERLLALQGLGLVRAEPGPIRLTAEGERLALGLVRKHRLLECFLAHALGLAWERVHEEACRLAPALSDDVAAGLARFLGDPATCPHGNPIPAADGTLRAEAAIALHELAPGRGAVIVRIEHEDPALLRYLAALGLLPQTKVEVEEIGPLGGPVLVRVGAARYALGRRVASRILVRQT